MLECQENQAIIIYNSAIYLLFVLRIHTCQMSARYLIRHINTNVIGIVNQPLQ